MDGILRIATTKSCFRRLQPTEADNGAAFHHLEHVLTTWREMMVYLEILGLLLFIALMIISIIAMIIYIYYMIIAIFQDIMGTRNELPLWPL